MDGQKKRLTDSIALPLRFIILIWAIHVFQLFSGIDLGGFGVFPREIFGLRGILFSPMVHSDFGHLMSNSAPLFFLSVMIIFFYPRVANRSMLMIYVLTGLAVWIFGRRVFHIGASGVVYGLVSFVFWMGIFRRSIKSIVLALIVTVLYSGLFLGILPDQEGISWESHLLGALVGIFTAYWFKEQVEMDEQPQQPYWENEPLDNPYFLERDVFEKTKKEREAGQNESSLW